MPVEIVVKRKTEPQTPQQHKTLVPLRISEIRPDRMRHYDREHLDEVTKKMEVGDIIVVLPDPASYGQAVFNCTKQSLLDIKYWDNGAVLCLRAYDVAQIVLTNDDEPAPV